MPPKRHHYLPQFFLERFCRDRTLCVFDRELKSYRRQQPVNTAVMKDYYAFKEEDGTKNVQIESLLGKIEGNARPILDKIDAGGELSIEDREHLAVFVGFLAARVPDFEKTVTEFVDHTVKHATDVMFSSLERTNQLMDGFERSRPGAKPIDREQLFEFLRGKQYDVKPHRNYVLATMLHVAVEQAALFAQMNWFVFRAPPKKSYTLSDNPLSIIAPRNRNAPPWMGTGILTPGAAKLIPLGAKICLVMGDRGDMFQYVDADDWRVRDANMATTIRADRFVFARDDRQLKSLVQATGIAHRERGKRIAFT